MEALTSVYINNPCRIQPTALWKTLGQINSFHSDFIIENDEIKSLKLWNDEMLHTYWHKDKKILI